MLANLVDDVLQKSPLYANSLMYQVDGIPGVSLPADKARQAALVCLENADAGRPAYGLGQWLQFLPEEERPAFLRELHDAMDGSQRAYFMNEAATWLRDPVDATFLEWFESSFEKALDQQGTNITGRVGVPSSGSVAIRLAASRVVAKRERKEVGLLDVLSIRIDGGEIDAVMKELAETSFLKDLSSEDNDLRAKARALQSKIYRFGKQREYLAIVDQALENDAENKDLLKLRGQILSRVGGLMRLRDLEGKLAEDPTDKGDLREFERFAQGEGMVVRAHDLLLRQAGDGKPSKMIRKRLVPSLQALGRPFEAAMYREELQYEAWVAAEKARKKAEEKEAEKKEADKKQGSGNQATSSRATPWGAGSRSACVARREQGERGEGARAQVLARTRHDGTLSDATLLSHHPGGSAGLHFEYRNGIAGAGTQSPHRVRNPGEGSRLHS